MIRSVFELISFATTMSRAEALRICAQGTDGLVAPDFDRTPLGALEAVRRVDRAIDDAIAIWAADEPMWWGVYAVAGIRLIEVAERMGSPSAFHE